VKTNKPSGPIKFIYFGELNSYKFVRDSVFKHRVACHIKTSMYNTVRQ
jgi:hypothetical protein